MTTFQAKSIEEEIDKRWTERANRRLTTLKDKYEMELKEAREERQRVLDKFNTADKHVRL